ncbi:HAD-IIB family hydrolase [uncultured Sulfitobacter sp.]|uniref:HAD-IIB family hydrolase n=1 Tax=uncultured Sulfitobacter sp. TaxID=191468 RepID=UPI0032B226FD
MAMSLPLLVFTDLDGTLLSHSSYRWDAATPALDTLRNIGAAVVLASSKTAPEIAEIRAELAWDHCPAIIENGAGILPPDSTDMPKTDSYVRLRHALDSLPAELRDPFCGFGDMTVAQIAQITGLSHNDAANAAERAFSEPGIWSGSAELRGAFIDALHDHGIHAREGGRFLTLSYGRTKADQMAALTDAFAPRHTLALGDAPNDIEMLQAAEFGVIVANPHRDPLPPLPGEDTDRIIRTTLPGPAGWNGAVLDLIARLNLN